MSPYITAKSTAAGAPASLTFILLSLLLTLCLALFLGPPLLLMGLEFRRDTNPLCTKAVAPEFCRAVSLDSCLDVSLSLAES